jgi:hypothetical protein
MIAFADTFQGYSGYGSDRDRRSRGILVGHFLTKRWTHTWIVPNIDFSFTDKDPKKN